MTDKPDLQFSFPTLGKMILYLCIASIGAVGNYFFQKIQSEKDIKLRQIELEKGKILKELEIIRQSEETKLAQEKAFDDITFIYDELAELVENTGAVRALIISVHNGDNEIRVGGEKKFDILYEVKMGQTVQRIKGAFQNYTLDEGNIRLASKAIDEGEKAVHIPDVTTEPMLDNDETQNTLEFLGIKSLTCKYIGVDEVTEKNMFFLYLNHEVAYPEKVFGNDFIKNYTSRSGRLIREKIDAY